MGGVVREPLKDLSACGLPEALEVMGERWSFMILRASFNGLHHFEEFLSELGIARNILSNRLGRLVDNGILDREPDPDDRRRIEYRLTEKGFDLLPAMLALRQWGQKYVEGFVATDPVLVDQRDRMPVGPVCILAHDGRVLAHENLGMVARANLPSKGKDRQEGELVPGTRGWIDDSGEAAVAAE